MVYAFSSLFCRFSSIFQALSPDLDRPWPYSPISGPGPSPPPGPLSFLPFFNPYFLLFLTFLPSLLPSLIPPFIRSSLPPFFPFSIHYSSLHSFIHAFLPFFLHLFCHSCIPSIIRSFPSFCSLHYSFIRSLSHSFIYTSLLFVSFSSTFICSILHSCSLSFNPPLTSYFMQSSIRCSLQFALYLFTFPMYFLPFSFILSCLLPFLHAFSMSFHPPSFHSFIRIFLPSIILSFLNSFLADELKGASLCHAALWPYGIMRRKACRKELTYGKGHRIEGNKEGMEETKKGEMQEGKQE